MNIGIAAPNKTYEIVKAKRMQIGAVTNRSDGSVYQKVKESKEKGAWKRIKKPNFTPLKISSVADIVLEVKNTL